MVNHSDSIAKVMNAPRIVPWVLVVRFLLAGVSVLAGIVYCEAMLLQWLIPIFRWILTHVDDRFHILLFDLVNDRGAYMVQLNVMFNHDIVIAQQAGQVVANLESGAALLGQNVLHPLMVFLTAILAWPVRHWHDTLRRFFVGFPLILGLMLIDTPIQLLANVMTNLAQEVDSPWVSATGLIYWSDFLNGGGLLALAIAVSVFSILRANGQLLRKA